MRLLRGWPSARVACWLLIATLSGSSLAFAQELSHASSPENGPAPRKGAGYVLPDGAVQIVTYKGMAGAVSALDALFARSHPGLRFKVLTGDNYTVMAALTFDRTLVAPLGSEYTRTGLGSNLKIAAEPVAIRVAHASLTPGASPPMLGVIVNAANPLRSLSRTQLIRLFAVGGPGGDIATWGQAGVTGPLAEREVHPIGPLSTDYLPSEDPQAGEFLGADVMNGLNMNHTYVGLADYNAVVERVKDDRAAVGITAVERAARRRTGDRLAG